MWHKSSDTLSTFVTPLSKMGVEKEKLTAQAFKGAFDLAFLLFDVFPNGAGGLEHMYQDLQMTIVVE